MGKRFNRYLRNMARAGISVGDINQASSSFLASPQGASTVKAAAKKQAKPTAAAGPAIPKNRKQANKVALHAAMVNAGIDPIAAGATVNNPNQKWQQTFSQAQEQISQAQDKAKETKIQADLVKAQREAEAQRQQFERDMLTRQAQLIEAAKPPPAPISPRDPKDLRARGYESKFRTRGSRAERKRAVSKGTAQFSNPLSMGGGIGSSTINL